MPLRNWNYVADTFFTANDVAGGDNPRRASIERALEFARRARGLSLNGDPLEGMISEWIVDADLATSEDNSGISLRDLRVRLRNISRDLEALRVVLPR